MLLPCRHHQNYCHKSIKIPTTGVRMVSCDQIIQRFICHGLFVVALALPCRVAVADDKASNNLATSATVTASSEHGHLPAVNVIDGRICPPAAALGEFGSWAVLGDKEKGQGQISFTWPQPTQVAEIVYFGRCAWQTEEVFKGYEVYAAGQAEPIAQGELAKQPGPQRITFPPVNTTKLTLKFLSSHGGSNPGANEIMVFAEPTDEAQLDRHIKFAANSLWSDHAVMQQHVPVRVWGTAADGEKITLEFRGHRAETTAADGKWQITLPPQSPGEPAEMKISTPVKQFVIRDVLVGEVWIASGQSNMEMPVDVSYWPSKYDGVQNAKQEVAEANYPQIRMFYVPRIADGRPRDDSGGQWRVCSPETVGGFAAVPYFFGRKLHQELKVPVGLIDCSWGATYIEPWTSFAGLQSVPELAEVTQRALKELDEFSQAMLSNPDSPPASHQHQPTRLFNGMIHRLTPFAIRGALWYQGEGNVGDGMKYYHKMRALIGGWREAWGQGQFPFLYVQLTPYDYGMYKGSKDPYKLPALWEAQTAALAVPNTGMVVTTDISDVKNIHPPNKQEVGNRLARWALNGTYGKTDVPYRGPMFHHFTVEPNQIRVVFDPGDGVLKSRDDKPLSWFTVAGDDRVFHPAEATIESNSVVVRSSEVLTPRHVRFAWHKLAEPNLANKAGLPAVPFRTDSWTVQTGLED
jgi:sialate O-acetylesterase